MASRSVFVLYLAPAHVADVTQTESVHAALKAKKLLPDQHFVDGAYTDAREFVTSGQHYQIDLVALVSVDACWQAKDPDAYDLSQFRINWKTRRVTCPQGKKTQNWRKGQDPFGTPIISAKFSRTDCRLCSARARHTQTAVEARELTFRPQAEHDALQAARHRQQTEEWKLSYSQRAGIEGTLSQAIATMGLRQTRYIGLAKTHLQHVLASVALNIQRIIAWLMGIPHAQTRISRFAALAPDSA